MVAAAPPYNAMPNPATKKPTRKKASPSGRVRASDGQRELSAAKKKAILKSLAGGCSVTTACGCALTGRTTFYKWLEADPGFAEAVAAAENKAIKSVEDAMFRRARSMTYNGAVTAGIFLLKNKRPDDYQDVHRVNFNGTVAVDRVAVLQGLVEGGESGADPAGGDSGQADA